MIIALNLALRWQWDNGWHLFWLQHYLRPLHPQTGIFK